MSDYEQTRYGRGFPQSHSTGGSGLFWVLAVVAVLGLLVLLGAVGGSGTPVEHPGGAGGEPIVVPVDPETAPASTGTLVD